MLCGSSVYVLFISLPASCSLTLMPCFTCLAGLSSHFSSLFNTWHVMYNSICVTLTCLGDPLIMVHTRGCFIILFKGIPSHQLALYIVFSLATFSPRSALRSCLSHWLAPYSWFFLVTISPRSLLDLLAWGIIWLWFIQEVVLSSVPILLWGATVCLTS